MLNSDSITFIVFKDMCKLSASVIANQGFGSVIYLPGRF